MANPVYADPTDHPEVEGFLRHLAENGADNLSKSVFGDWLDEHGYENAAHGMRWAANHDKRPEEPARESGLMSGWYGPGINGPLTPHQLPRAILTSHPGNVSYQEGQQGPYASGPMLSNYRHAGPDRMMHHWKDYLQAVHNAPFDENGDLLSKYPPGHRLHNTDLAHS